MPLVYDPVGGFSARSEKTRILNKALSGPGAAVIDNRDGCITLDIRLCRQDRYEDILRLQRNVYESISDKVTFVQTTKEELVESLDKDFCIGAFSGEELSAFTLMVTNRQSPRNLGCLFDDTAEAARSSVTYDTTFVSPRCVGCGLQRYFIRIKDVIAVLLGADKAYATVSPDNIVSLRNLRSNGFETVDKKRMYGGYWRYVLRKRLDKK